MAKAATQFACTDCGYSAGRWFGKCPSCGEFGTLVEEAPAKANGGSAAKPTLRLIDVKAEEAERIPTGVRRARPRARRRARAGLARARRRRARRRQVDAAAHARSPRCRPTGAALLVTGEESVAQVKLRAARLGGAEQVEILAETELETVCATLEQEKPDVCVIDSVQTLYSSELGSAPGSVGAGARGRRAPPARGQGGRRRDDPRRPRDEGRGRRRPARARAPRRLRAPVRGRPLPRAPRPARRPRTASARPTSSPSSR